MSSRRSLTAAQKRDAIMQCDHISKALRELAMGTLNRRAKISDTGHALRLANSIERLRDRIWKYPVTRDLPGTALAQHRARMTDRN